MNRLNFGKPYLLATLLLSLGLSQTGCGLLLGNIRPVEEKSEAYGVADLAKHNPDWVRLDPAALAGPDSPDSANSSNSKDSRDPATRATEISDMVFQSKKTAATISINSACRPGREPDLENREKDLKALTNLLLLGITDITVREEKPLSIQSYSALETTIRGRLNDEEVMLRAVVFRRQDCVFDLVYLSPPQSFEKNVPDFSHFIASLRLK